MTDASLESNVKTFSRPTELKITDLRIVNLRALPFDVSILRIDTNQGISGYGEVRDGASPSYALLLKSRLLGENPCNIDKIFRVRSNNLDFTAGRVVASVASRWRSLIWRAKPMACRLINWRAANSATKS